MVTVLILHSKHSFKVFKIYGEKNLKGPSKNNTVNMVWIVFVLPALVNDLTFIPMFYSEKVMVKS